ncbi:MAG: hypothetical protein HKN27_07760 [Silicimonas sp.]|nr:hypothetical protein [Silicimonas sp.]
MANVGHNLLLVPNFGIMGAAVATESATAIWTGLMFVAVYKKLGIRTSVL